MIGKRNLKDRTRDRAENEDTNILKARAEKLEEARAEALDTKERLASTEDEEAARDEELLNFGFPLKSVIMLFISGTSSTIINCSDPF